MKEQFLVNFNHVGLKYFKIALSLFQKPLTILGRNNIYAPEELACSNGSGSTSRSLMRNQNGA